MIVKEEPQDDEEEMPPLEAAAPDDEKDPEVGLTAQEEHEPTSSSDFVYLTSSKK